MKIRTQKAQTVKEFSEDLGNIFLNRRFINEKCRHANKANYMFNRVSKKESHLLRTVANLKQQAQQSFQRTANANGSKKQDNISSEKLKDLACIFYKNLRNIEKVFQQTKKQSHKGHSSLISSSCWLSPEKNNLIENNTVQRTKVAQQSYFITPRKEPLQKQQKREGYSVDVSNIGIDTKYNSQRVSKTIGLKCIGQKNRKNLKMKFSKKYNQGFQHKQNFSLPNFIVTNTKKKFNNSSIHSRKSNRILPLTDKQHKHVIIIEGVQKTAQPSEIKRNDICLNQRQNYRKKVTKNQFSTTKTKINIQSSFEPWPKSSSYTKLEDIKLRSQ